MKQNYYLHLEAVNIDAFTSDTHNLSVIRGGSMLLRNAIDRIQREFNLKSISTGASIGFFEFEREENKAIDLHEEVRNYLAKDPYLKHATFVVEIFPKSGNYVKDRKRLLALNRWQQFQQPTLSLPELNTDTNTTRACALEGKRPGTEKPSQKEVEENYLLSPSVNVRLDYGRKERHQFYKKELKKANLTLPDGTRFIWNFKDLARLPNKGLGHPRGHLHDKMAVLYFDGNKFTEALNEIIRCAEKEGSVSRGSS